MPSMTMDHEKDPKSEILDRMGDLSSVEIFNNQVLCAVYQRPERTKNGIILTSQTRDEDKYQGKVGLFVKMGSEAFKDASDQWFKGATFDEGDWVVFRPSDGWSLEVNSVLCRIIDDVNVRGRVQQPDQIW